MGLPMALAAGRALAGMLFGVDPANASALGSARALLLATAGAAAAAPAFRAARTHPVAALRSE